MVYTEIIGEDFYRRESPYLKYVSQSVLVDTNNSKLKDSHMIGRYRPIKPSDSMIKMLRSIVTALQSMTENARLCDNPECGELSTFMLMNRVPSYVLNAEETFSGKVIR